MIVPPSNIRMEVGDGLTIRDSSASDLPAILRLLSQMHEDEALIVPSDSAHAAFEDMLGSRSRRILVATKDDVVVGTVDVFVMPNLTRGCRPWAGIENLVVDEPQRGHGYGRALLDAALSIARDAGCYKVQLVSHDKRDVAHTLYERRGFTAPVRGYRRYLDA